MLYALIVAGEGEVGDVYVAGSRDGLKDAIQSRPHEENSEKLQARRVNGLMEAVEAHDQWEEGRYKMESKGEIWREVILVVSNGAGSFPGLVY